uniref:amino acid transporter n=1 Tax=Pararhizobium sp. IMCC3301 TaxID=3067904 RepID=UPI0027408A20|nr:amino acid transporter [Pararhizobium sp. IMCC3301]
MAFSKRTPVRANTTPVLDRNTKHSFWAALAKVIAVPMIPLLLLMWFGSPALRMSYRWNGDHQASVYSHCLYLNLMSGWEHVDPLYGVNNCPLITFFPFNIVNFIKG